MSPRVQWEYLRLDYCPHALMDPKFRIRWSTNGQINPSLDDKYVYEVMNILGRGGLGTCPWRV